MTVFFPPENLIRAPFELGWSPARSSSTPALASSSLYLVIAEMSSSVGITPASESLFAFTIIMNRIVVFPFRLLFLVISACQYGSAAKGNQSGEEADHRGDRRRRRLRAFQCE